MRRNLAATVGLATVAVMATPAVVMAAADGPGRPSPAQQSSLDLGIQAAPKGASSAARQVANTPNPYLANLPDLTDADYFTWNKEMHRKADLRANSAQLAENRRTAAAASGTALAPRPFVHDEEEPAGTAGSNDTVADAERISPFGTLVGKNNRVRILGSLDAPASVPSTHITTSEDQGSIPRATPTGITGSRRVTVDSVLGDGPHGSSGSDSNDFDFYRVDVPAGQSILANTEGSPGSTDTVLVVYDAEGNPLAADDDGGTGSSSNLSYTPSRAGTYYVMVAGYSFLGTLPTDPFDSGSGRGAADEGDYKLAISAERVDADFYSVKLRPGDTLGAVARGSADGLAITTPSGEQRVGGVGTDASSLYPPNSPLPGGGNTTIAYVAEEAGWYAVQVSGTSGAYDVTVEAYRAGTKTDYHPRTQTVLLDFDPGRVNTGIWGGAGVRNLSPFSSFVPKWGIPRADTAKLQNRILNTVRANLQSEVEAHGLNPDVNVEVLDARTHPELIGQKNVSRIYVAGSIAESGISTIGIAQYIDPGNFGHEDEAIVLLDVLSANAGPISSLNTFMNASSDRVKFVSAAVGNVIAHEVGHTIGNYHTDNSNMTGNVMDSGGGNFAYNLYGVGPDNVGGTADDTNVKFVKDTYSPPEGFTGKEDTLNVTAWAYSGR